MRLERIGNRRGVGDDAEDHLVELRLRGIEVMRGLLDDDAILRHTLGKLPGPHAYGSGSEVVPELLHGRRRHGHPRAVGQLRQKR